MTLYRLVFYPLVIITLVVLRYAYYYPESSIEVAYGIIQILAPTPLLLQTLVRPSNYFRIPVALSYLVLAIFIPIYFGLTPHHNYLFDYALVAYPLQMMEMAVHYYLERTTPAPPIDHMFYV